MIDYTKLKYLLYIRKYHSFTKASEELHITQPSLSIAIKNLEQECGAKLINRTTRKVSLTPLGEKIADLAQHGFKFFNQIEDILKENNNLYTPNITIRCNSNLFEHVYINLSDYLIKNTKHNTTINVVPLEDNESIEMLLSKYPNDYILTICSEYREFSNHIQFTYLAQSKTFLAVSSNTKQIYKKALSLQDLLDIPLIIPQKKYGFQEFWIDKLEQIGNPKIKFSSPDAKAINILASKDLGGVLYLDFDYWGTGTNLHLIPIKNSPIFYITLLCLSEKEQSEIENLKSIIMP